MGLRRWGWGFGGSGFSDTCSTAQLSTRILQSSTLHPTPQPSPLSTRNPKQVRQLEGSWISEVQLEGSWISLEGSQGLVPGSWISESYNNYNSPAAGEQTARISEAHATAATLARTSDHRTSEASATAGQDIELRCACVCVYVCVCVCMYMYVCVYVCGRGEGRYVCVCVWKGGRVKSPGKA